MASLDQPVSQEATATNVPLTKLLLRGKEGVHLLRGPDGAKGVDDARAVATVVPDDSVTTLQSGLCEFSPCGALLARTSAEGVEIVHTDAQGPPRVITDCAAGRVQKLAWSPRSTYLVTWQKPEAASAEGGGGCGGGGGGGGASGGGGNNLRAFEVATGRRVAAFPMKKISSMAWPALQWTSDESYVMLMMANEVRVYDGRQLDKGFIGKVQAPGLASMSVSPSATLPVKVACFTPETKDRPGSVRIHQFPQLDGAASPSKTFYNAQEANLDWSPDGSAVLIKTHTDVDKSGASYYGSTGLYLLHANGSFDSQVALPKEGPLSDAKWSPTSRCFAVICGTMPAVATLFDAKAKPTFTFGSAHRSVVSWSPHGRFLCLGGFGNLAGDCDFWDVNKLKKMGSCNSHCAVSYGWSPCSRFFMTATCAPRMNVDNCVKLFRYTGALALHLPHEQLFDARWRPALPGAFPDRAQSPARVAEAPQLAKLGAGGSFAVAKVGAYRPPGSSGKLAAMMRAEREGTGIAAAKVSAVAAAKATTPNLIVGMAPPKESNAAKNK